MPLLPLLDPVSPIPALVATLVALATCSLLARRFGVPSTQGRYASIDGLRGYLAFFVFLHHACIGYFYFKSGSWGLPPSNLYTHLGQSSVAMFFMITGFLFFSKLMNGKQSGMDWGKLYVSRVMRLTPLYFFAVLIFLLAVVFGTHGAFNATWDKVVIAVLKLLGFRLFGSPHLEDIAPVLGIISSVTGTLRHEWGFYLSLPLIALTLRIVSPMPYLILGFVAMALWHPHDATLIAFLSGITTALLARIEKFCQFASGKLASGIVIACIVTAVAAFPSPFGTAAIFLIAIAFALIACGNTLFGALINPAPRMLGEISYSVYLLHCVTLIVTLSFVFGFSGSQALASTQYWLMIIGLTPILVLICFTTFTFIEQPAIRSAPAVTRWLRVRKSKP